MTDLIFKVSNGMQVAASAGVTVKDAIHSLTSPNLVDADYIQDGTTHKMFTATERAALAAFIAGNGITPYTFVYHLITPSTTGQVVYEAEGIVAALPVVSNCNLVHIYAYTSDILSGGDLVISIKRNGAVQLPTVTITSGSQENNYTYLSPVAYIKDDILTVSFGAGAIQTGISLFFALYFSSS